MDFAQWEDFVRQMDPLIRLVVRQTLCHHHRRPVRDELKELRQEVYFRLVNRQARGLTFLAGREPKELRAYVSAVARAVVVDAVRAAEAIKRNGGDVELMPPSELANLALDPGRGPEELLLIKECLRCVAVAASAAGLARGDGRRRNLRILYLALFAGMTSREIAGLAGMALAPSTVDTVVYRARRHLALGGLEMPRRCCRSPRL
jgi:DNA-directed RNA polymerase specialized sigma24 family protein